MEEMRFLKRLNAALVARLLAAASGEILPPADASLSLKESIDRRRYIILLCEYGLLDMEADGAALGGCYPRKVRSTGITDRGRAYLVASRATEWPDGLHGCALNATRILSHSGDES